MGHQSQFQPFAVDCTISRFVLWMSGWDHKIVVRKSFRSSPRNQSPLTVTLTLAKNYWTKAPDEGDVACLWIPPLPQHRAYMEGITWIQMCSRSCTCLDARHHLTRSWKEGHIKSVLRQRPRLIEGFMAKEWPTSRADQSLVQSTPGR